MSCSASVCESLLHEVKYQHVVKVKEEALVKRRQVSLTFRLSNFQRHLKWHKLTSFQTTRRNGHKKNKKETRFSSVKNATTTTSTVNKKRPKKKATKQNVVTQNNLYYV